MRRTPFLVQCAVYLILFVLAAGCSSDKQLKKLEQGAVVLAFGDSLTFGTGAAPESSYPSVLAELTGYTVINAGVPGELSAAGLKRLPLLLNQYKPELVILCHGANDILRRKESSSIIPNLSAMIELIQKSGADVVLIGVPRFSIFLTPPDYYQHLSDQYKIPYAPDIVPDILGKPELRSDRVHPNAQGYTIMAAGIAGLIKKSQP